MQVGGMLTWSRLTPGKWCAQGVQVHAAEGKGESVVLQLLAWHL